MATLIPIASLVLMTPLVSIFIGFNGDIETNGATGANGAD